MVHSDLDGVNGTDYCVCLCSHEQTDLLIETWDSTTLWDNFGIQTDVVVSSNDLGSKSCRYGTQPFSHLHIAFPELIFMFF